jgi:hypothetical protein
MALKLHSISFTGLRVISGIRLESFEIDRPGAFKDWRVALRGQTLLLISPPGWTSSTPSTRDREQPCFVLEIPRSDVILRWRSDDADIDLIAKGLPKYDSGQLGWTPAPVESDKAILAQVPAHQVGD